MKYLVLLEPNLTSPTHTCIPSASRLLCGGYFTKLPADVVVR